MIKPSTWTYVQAIKTTGKTDWLAIEAAIKAVCVDIADCEADALDGIRLISDIIGKGTGRGYPYSDRKRQSNGKDA